MKKIALLLTLIFIFNLSAQTTNEKLILEEANKRNITTTEEAISELNKNGITIGQAQEIAKMQGIDLNTFLSNNFGLQKSNINKITESSSDDVKESIEIISEPNVNIKNNKSLNVNIDIEGKYFGYSIFENNPFATKNYLVGNIDEGYLLSPGDELRITVYGNNALTTESKIDLNGNIIFPELGVFQAAGNTLKTLKSRLKLFLGKFYNGLVSQPQRTFLDVSLTQIRPVSVNILGDAVTPGPHLVNGLASVLNAIYSAGGIKTSGSLRKIFLYRNNKLLKEFDLYDFITNGNIDSDIRLMNSDVIFIPSRLSSITLSGAVKNEAIFELKDGETIENLFDFSGGLPSNASLDDINLSRIVPFEKRTQKQNYDRFLSTISYSDNKELKLIDGDLIEVKSILKKRLNEISLRGNIKKPGTFSLTTYNDLKELIEIGGNGLLPNTYLEKVDVIKENMDGIKSFKTYKLSSILTGKIKVELEQDDIVRVYSLDEVEGEKLITVSGFGTDEKTIFWRKGLSVFDVIFESTSFNNVEFQSQLLSSRLDVDSFDKQSGLYRTNIYSFNNIIELKKVYLNPKDKIRLYSKSVTEDLFPTIIVTGSVNNPKTIFLRDSMLVEDALIEAGGFEKYAIKNRVDIVRKLLFSEENLFSETISHDIDLNYLLGINETPNNPRYLQDQDVIVVRKPKRDDVISTVQIDGEVNIPGTYSFSNFEITTEDLISDSGGLTEYSFLNSSQFFRDGELLSYKNIKQFKSQILKPNDYIVIGTALDDVKITGNGIMNPGIATWNKKRARNYIRSSGGMKKRIESKVILRKNGSSRKIKGFLNNPKVYPGDIILISKKPEKEKSNTNFYDEFSTIFGLITGTLTTILLITKL